MGAVNRVAIRWVVVLIFLLSFSVKGQVQIGNGSGNVINSPIEQCGNGGISLTAQNVTSSSTLAWSILSTSVGNGTLALSANSGSAITVTPSVTSFTIFEVELSESTTSKDTVIIAVAPLTVFPASFPSILCESNGAEIIETNASSNVSYTTTGGSVFQTGSDWEFNPIGQVIGSVILTKTVTYTNSANNISFSCADSKTITITKPSNPSLSLGVPFIIKCQTATSITAMPANGVYVLKESGQTTYSPISSAINNNGSLNTSFLNAGSGQSLGYYYTDGNGCISDTAFVSFNVVDPSVGVQSYLNGQYSTVSATNSVYSVCGGYDSLTFQLQLPSGSIFPSIDIDWGDGTVQTGITNPDSITHQFGQQGLYTIELDLSNNSGCSVSKEVKVFFGTTPPVGLTSLGGLSGCIGLGGYSDTFLFRVEDPLDLPVGLEMTFSSNNGSQAFTVTTPLIDTSVSPPTTVHPRLRLDPVDGELYYYHVFDDGSCGTTSVLGTPQSNSFYVTAVCVSPCGPGADPLGPIYISEAPVAGANVPPTACTGSAMTISDNSSSGEAINTSTGTCNSTTKGVWKIIGNSPHTVNSGSKGFIPSGSFGNNPSNWIGGTSSISVSFSNPGTYTVRRIIAVLQSSNPGCTMDSIDYQVCVDTVPRAKLLTSRLDSVCAGDQITLELETDSVNCDDQTDYSIKLYQGNTLIQTLLDSAGNKVVNFNAPSSYGEYHLEFILSNNCGSTSVIDSFYVFEPLNASFKASFEAFCYDSVSLTIDTSLYIINTLESAGSLANVQITPSTGWSTSGSNPQQILFFDYGFYTLTLSFDGVCGGDSIVKQLQLKTPPPASFSLSDTTTCSPFFISSIPLTTQSSYSHTWKLLDPSGILISQQTTVNGVFSGINTSTTFDSIYIVRHIVFDTSTNCYDSLDISFTVYPDPVSSFVLPSVVCAGDTLTVQDSSQGNGLTYRWMVSDGGVISDTTFSEPDVFFPDNQAPNGDTTYTLTLIVTSEDGCKDTAIQNVLIHARPKAAFSADSLQCGSYSGVLHDSSQFSGPGPLTYAWTVASSVSGAGVATLSSATAASPTLTIPAPSVDSVTYRITLVVTDSYGCTDEHLDSVKVYARPTASFSVADTGSCGPYDLLGKITDVSDNGFSSNTTAGLERRWLVERGNVVLHDSIGTELDYTLTNTGVDDSVYTITLIATNEKGCSDTAYQNVRIYPNALAQVDSLVTLTQCAPFLVDSTVLKAVDYPNTNGNYIWTVLDGSSTTFNGLSGLNYLLSIPDSSLTIRLVVESDHGCKSDTVEVQITTIPNPDASFVIADTLGCALFTPAVNSITASSSITHDWNIIDSSATSNLVLQTATTYQPAFTGLSNPSATSIKKYWVQHIVTAGSGCTDTAFLPVYVHPNPEAGFSLPSTICAGSTVSVNDTSQGNGLTYRWQVSGGGAVISDTTLSEPDVFFPDNQAPNGDTTYTLTLIVTSEDGCKDTAIQNVVIHARPKADFSVDSLQCGSYSGVLNDSSQFSGPGLLTYAWNVASSVSGAGVATLSSATAASPTLTIPAPSVDSVTYRITLVVTDSYGCTDEHLDSVKVYARPTASFSVADTGSCGPYDLLGKITDVSDNGFSSNTTAGLERRWLVERGNVVLHDSIGTELDYTLTNTGVDDSVYTITLIATNEKGCSDTAYQNVRIYPNALAQVDSLVTLTQCAPFLVDSTVLKAVDYPNANGNYIWTVLDGSSTTFNGLSGLNYLLSIPDSSLTIRLVVESDHGCKSDTVEVQITTIPNPDASFVIADTLGCALFTPAVNSITASSSITHDWNIIDSSATSNLVLQTATTYQPAFTGLSNPSATSIKKYWVQHIVTAGSGCTDTAFLPVYVHPNPEAGFSLPSTICAGSTVSVNDTSQGNGLTYRWQVSGGGAVISDTTLSEPDVFFPDNQAPNGDTTYTLTLIVTSEDGCKDTAIQNVVIHARPKADFSVDSLQCGSYSGVLNDSSQFSGLGLLTYAWNVASSVSGAGVATLSSATAASPTLTIPAPSVDSVTYRITLVVTDSYGCTDEHLDSVKVYARPTASFSVADTGSCGPYDLLGKITDVSDNGFSSNTTAGLERRWLVERGNVVLHDSIGTELDYTLTNTGVDDSVYTITLIATNEKGCSDTAYESVTIYPNSRAELLVNASLYNCAPFTVDTSIVSAIEYPNANDTYSWNVYDSITGTLVYGPVNGIDNLSFALPVADSTVLIVLSTSNTNGCGDDSDTITVGTLPNPDASFTFYQDTVCSGDSVYMSLISGNGQTTYDWYIDSTGNGMQFISSGTNTFISILENDGDTALQQMLIKCVATIGSTGCSDSITLPVSVRPNPMPSLTQNLVCGLDTVQLIGNTAKNSLVQSWNWVLGTSLLTGQSVNTYYGNAGYYSGILATTTYAGCMRQVVDSIVVYDYPTANFTMNTLCAPDTTCAGETIVFNDSSYTTGVLQGMINSWAWDINNDGSTESGLQNYNTSLNGFGYVDLELVVTNQHGCSDSIVKSPFVQVEPQAEISFTQDTTCAPWQTSFVVQDTGYIDSTYFILRALDGGGTGSIIVSQGQVIDSVITNLQPNYFTDSIFTIEHTVWNCCGSSTDFDSIYLKTPPVADYAVVPDTGCTPFTTTFVLQNKVRGNASYAVLDYGNGQIDTIIPQLINSPNGFISVWPNQTATYTYSGVADTSYQSTLSVFNDCGDSTFSRFIHVLPNNVVALIDAPSTEGCAPFAVDFENLTTGATNYSWCFDWDGTTCSGGGSNSFEPSWTFTVPGNYQVAMFADNGCGYDTAYLEVIVNPSPTSSFTTNAPVCSNDTLTLLNSSTVSTGFLTVNEWTIDSLATYQTQNVDHIINRGGNYGISLYVESDNGCSDSSYQSVTINHNPEVNFSFQNACLNEQPIQFYDSTAIQGAAINYTYWDFGDGNGSIALSPSYSYAQPGTYQVKLIKGSTQGCLDSMVQTITIFDIPVARFRPVLTSGDSCSIPQTYEFQNLTNGAQAYQWDFDYVNSLGQFTSTQSTPTFTYTSAGVYDVRLISFNAFGCTDTAYKTVVVNDGVVADFDVSPVNGCDPLTLNLLSQPIYNAQLDTIDYVRWELSSGWSTVTSDSITQVIIDQPGQFELNYFVYTNQGCSDSIIGQRIDVYPTPEPEFTISKKDIRTFDFINTGTYLDTTLQFLWSFGDGDTSMAFSPEHRYTQTAMMDSLRVCLVVRNGFNCFESICKPLFMWDYNLSVPNSIVPERTQFGEDALFLPKGHDLMNYQLSIFDKWGNLVFESEELLDGAPLEPWNGRFKNQGPILPMGAYVWKIEATFNDGHVWQGNSYSGEKAKRYGTLMLIR